MRQSEAERYDFGRSKHGNNQSQYDAELDQAAQLAQAKATNANSYVAKIVLFGESQFTLKDQAGNLVISLKCFNDGETHSLSLPADCYHVQLISPEDVELYIDGESRSYEGSSNELCVEFLIGLTA